MSLNLHKTKNIKDDKLRKWALNLKETTRCAKSIALHCNIIKNKAKELDKYKEKDPKIKQRLLEDIDIQLTYLLVDYKNLKNDMNQVFFNNLKNVTTLDITPEYVEEQLSK